MSGGLLYLGHGEDPWAGLGQAAGQESGLRQAKTYVMACAEAG